MAAKKNPAPKTLDLAALTITDEAPLPKRVRDDGPNPFTDAIAASWDKKSGKSVTVPTGDISPKSGRGTNVVKVENLIRAAAAAQGLGVAIVTEDAGNGNTRILFQAKVRKQKHEKVSGESGAEDAGEDAGDDAEEVA